MFPTLTVSTGSNPVQSTGDRKARRHLGSQGPPLNSLSARPLDGDKRFLLLSFGLLHFQSFIEWTGHSQGFLWKTNDAAHVWF